MADEQTNLRKPARVFLVEDHPAVREALGARINAQADMVVCGEAAELGEAVRKIADLQPDVVLVDIALKSGDGPELIKQIAARHRRAKMLVHSMYEETAYADRCLHAGAMGYINKRACPGEVVKALREVAAGKVWLSPAMGGEILRRTVAGKQHTDPVDALTDRQLEIFRLLGDGLTAAQIARQLHISKHTVETRRENIKQRLNVGNISALTRLAAQWAIRSNA